MVDHDREDRGNGAERPWIRGVNIGGWLLMERFITPYFFAITSCHVQGDFCWYPGQIDAPPVGSPDHQYCDLYNCKPHLIDSAAGGRDFPTDEYTLAASFPDKNVARRYFQYHWDNFVTLDDLKELKAAGVNHVRVPLSHWILGNIEEGEPWVDGGWFYFVRFAKWCRGLGIEVWPDVHTAPGSQNGFDNSGQLLAGGPTCRNWSGSEENVQRSLQIVRDITKAIKKDGLGDVVTGFGVLNEQFADCDRSVVRRYNTEAYNIVQTELGVDTAVYIGDMFNATTWNDGWWTDEDEYSNTFLDSHYYHVFAEKPRALTPKQHIAYVCGHNHRDTVSCCYEDHPKNNVPSKGITRLIGEWSASYDTLVVDKLGDVMKGIEQTGKAPELDREIPQARKDFLRNFVEAQMVAYEAQDEAVSRGWFYWTLKTEGGAFAEWDFLRGLREGWIPSIPDSSVSSTSLYGTCHDIAERTKDDMSIVHEFPDPSTLSESNWQGVDIDDDYVLSHAGSFGNAVADEDQEPDAGEDEKAKNENVKKGEESTVEVSFEHNKTETAETQTTGSYQFSWFPLIAVVFFCFAIWHVFFKHEQARNRYQYTNIDSGSALHV